jgi:hypothetical protein
VFLLPNDPSPNGSAENMIWQLRSHMRFNIYGGYAVFNDHGHSSYQATDPEFVKVLRAVGRTGTAPTPADLAAAAASLKSLRLDDIVITDQEPHADVVTRVAAQLTGCQAQAVLDVTLCAIPRAG